MVGSMEFGTRLPVNEPLDIITKTVTMNNNNLNPNFVLVPVAVPNQEVVTYSNAATDKARILTENRNKSGIYS